MLPEELKPKTLYDLAHRLNEYISELRKDNAHSKALGQHLGEFISYASRQRYNDSELRMLTIQLTDEMYLQISKMEQRDKYTDAYFDVFLRLTFAWLKRSNALAFYILDNSLRDDRFKLSIELFALAGFECIFPYKASALQYSASHTRHPSREFKDVASQIDQSALDQRHILYVEKDDSVNYLKPVMEIAAEVQIKYICIFRNSAPDSGEPPHCVMGDIGSFLK